MREFYDAAVSGADPIQDRPGFAALLEYIAGNGARIILVESASRFARDLAVQITGLDLLKARGFQLVPRSQSEAESRSQRVVEIHFNGDMYG